MERAKERIDRLDHYFGDMYTRQQLRRIITPKKYPKRVINRTVKDVMIALGIDTTELIAGGHDEYDMEFI